MACSTLAQQQASWPIIRRKAIGSTSGCLFKAYRDRFPFLVGGSDDDPFEHRQVDLTRKAFVSQRAWLGRGVPVSRS
jgi:hypothetical protein